MKFLWFCLYLTFAKCVVSNYTTNPSNLQEMEYREGVLMDPKYSLPQVNVSASDGNHTVVPASLARVLDFYNTELLAANFDRIKETLSASCRKDVQLYLEGLRKAEKWALKSGDLAQTNDAFNGTLPEASHTEEFIRNEDDKPVAKRTKCSCKDKVMQLHLQKAEEAIHQQRELHQVRLQTAKMEAKITALKLKQLEQDVKN